jgi:hypothetical protein
MKAKQLFKLNTLTLFLLSLILTGELYGQGIKANCARLQDGEFYSYPKNSEKSYVFIRRGNMEKEVEINTRDTSLWNISWNDCNYTMNFVSSPDASFKKIPNLKNLKFAYKIETVTDTYSTYKGYLNKTSGNPIQADTIWFQPKKTPSNAIQFTPVLNEGILKKGRFSDTSKYAVLYVYSPKHKTICQNSDYYIYLNSTLMFASQNVPFTKPSYIFKLFTKGIVELVSATESKESKITANVEFGKRYYLKSDIKWGAPCYPALTLVDPDIGKDEYEKAQ